MRRRSSLRRLSLAAAFITLLVASPSAVARGQGSATPSTPAKTGPAATNTPLALPEFEHAHSAVREILSRDEFQPAQPTWWDRQLSRIRLWIAKLFMGVDRLTTMAPWIGHALEWLLFIAAAVGLFLWLLRAAKRQRLRVALNAASTRASTQWDRESADWRRLAEQHAAANDWREAIHALYWAAIVHLESRRAWRHNPTRTPREYVRLLPPGSAQRDALSRLTTLLELVWYGLRPARTEQFQEARNDFDRLASANSAREEAA